jgi:hypothetical protein
MQGFVLNATNGTVNYTSSISYGSGATGWLTMNPSTYTITPNGSAWIPVTVSVGSLAAGTYTATITCTDTANAADRATVTVTFVVTLPPVLSVNPSSLSFNAAVAQSSPAPQTLTLNTSNANASWNSSISYGSGATGWLSLSPSIGTVALNTPSNVTVNAVTGSLAAGTYTAVITIHNTTNSANTLTVNVTLNVRQPILTYSVSTLSYTLNPGGSTTASPSALGASYGNINWSSSISYGSGASNWLSVAPSSGSLAANASTTPVLTIAAGSIAPGIYNATLTFNNNTNTANKITVSVSLKIVGWINYTTSNSGLVSNNVKAVAVDSNNVKWFGTASGVSKFDGTTWTTYTTSNSGLANNNVTAVAIDSSGIKWFGTAGGVSKFDGTTWTTYNTSNSNLVSNNISAITIDFANNKWFGSSDNGVSELNRLGNWSRWQITGCSGVCPNVINSCLSYNGVASMYADPNGNIWIGHTYYTGVTEIQADYSGSTPCQVYKTTNSSLAGDWVTSISGYGSTILFGTNNGANVVTVAGNTLTWQTDRTSNGLSSNSITAVALDSTNKQLFGTQANGISEYIYYRFVNYTTANSGLVSNNIQAIALDSSNIRWIGTSGGVSERVDVDS